MKLSDPVSKILDRKGRKIFSVSPESSVYEAVELLSERNIGAVLVMVGDELVGIFSERDYARKAILKGKSSRKTTVREIMISPVITGSADDAVESCMMKMTEGKFRHLPLVHQGKVDGVVSIGDLVNWIISAQEETINQLEDYISGNYPG